MWRDPKTSTGWEMLQWNMYIISIYLYLHTIFIYFHTAYIYIYMVPPLYLPHIAIYIYHIYTAYLSPSLTLSRLWGAATAWRKKNEFSTSNIGGGEFLRDTRNLWVDLTPNATRKKGVLVGREIYPSLASILDVFFGILSLYHEIPHQPINGESMDRPR